MILRFDRLIVLRLLSHSLASQQRLPTIDQVVDRQYWIESKSNEPDNEDFDNTWVDQNKIPSGLWLIQSNKETFSHLMSNGIPQLTQEKIAPDLDEFNISNPGESVWEFIPAVELLAASKDKRRKSVRFSVIEDSISVVE